jgi:UDP-galactopyranose mutase
LNRLCGDGRISYNILTVNQLFGLNIRTEEEMNDWLKTVQIPCDPVVGCQNAEEMAKSRVGEALYKAIFETYTIKQWNKFPRKLNASVTARIPVRSNVCQRH